MKSAIWMISLGSETSGDVLAPLLMRSAALATLKASFFRSSSGFVALSAGARSSVHGAGGGVGAMVLSRVVNVCEDMYGKLPLHWMWWPAIGGIGIGIDHAAHAFKIDLSLPQAILAIIACLLLPEYFAAMASTSSHVGRPDACSRLLCILGPEQADAMFARAQRWPPYFRMRMMQAK